MASEIPTCQAGMKAAGAAAEGAPPAWILQKGSLHSFLFPTHHLGSRLSMYYCAMWCRAIPPLPNGMDLVG